LERRLAARGGFCDCEIFLNGWQPRDVALDKDGEYLERPMPPSAGVRAGSTQPCRLWAGY
jgi:Protein of unknown function (DUF2695)